MKIEKLTKKAPDEYRGQNYNKKMEKKKMTFEEFCDPQYREHRQLQVKSEAVWLAFEKLAGLINISAFARIFFKKSQSWFSQKLNGHTTCGKVRFFDKEECTRIAASFRAIAAQLQEFADDIDKARE